ncbi:MAG: hypothetical protein Roseis2KO_18160 [Roseivirga sp.]
MKHLALKAVLQIYFAILLLTGFTTLAQEKHTLRGFLFHKQDTTPVTDGIAYIEGSTLAAVSNHQGRFEINSIPTGRRWLIVEKTGYAPLLLPVELTYGLRNVDTLYLEKQAEKQPLSFSKKEMSNSLRKFRQHIFGQRNFKKLTINNPEAFRITRNSPPRSDEPFHLQLSNEYLGYDISVWVRKFELTKNQQVVTDYLEASKYFKPKQASSEKEQRKWEFNRQFVYNGSLRNFLRHMLAKSLLENGFTCYAIEGSQRNLADKVRQGKKTLITYDNLTDYVTYYPDKERNINRLRIKQIIEVHYSRQKNAQGDDQVSYIIPANGFVQVYDSGLLLNPSQLSISGYMAEGGLSELLPIDY